MAIDRDTFNQHEEEELLRGFLEESDEMLAEIETTVNWLENEPSNLEPVHEIFRVVHSLKGNSSFFNFANVKRFCHTFESFLTLIRERTIETDMEIVQRILDGTDLLKTIFIRLAEGGGKDVELTADEEEFLVRVTSMIQPGLDDESSAPLRQELGAYFEKARKEGLLDEDSPVKDIHDIIDRHSPGLLGRLKDAKKAPSSRWLSGKLDITREYGELKSILEEAREDGQNKGDIFITSLERLIAKHWEAGQGDRARELESLRMEFETFYQDELGMDEMMIQSLASIIEVYEKSLKEIKQDESAEGKGPAGAEDHERKVSFVKVEESLLDTFLDNVGELITLSELFNFIQKKLAEGDVGGVAENFKNTNQTFREISQKLQESLYEIRKAPVEGAIAKLPRIVRNICRETGKSIKLITSGGATEVDKSMLEKLESILVHIVINASDHGIEKPKERALSGKAKEGKIDIKIKSDGLNLKIDVSDDGEGVSYARIRDKAVAKGLLTAEAAEKLSDKQTLGLILRPGFSTREHVTERSGRGVGLDVVASRVREMGGSLSLGNMPGEGFNVNISMPLAYVSRIKMGLSMLVGSKIFLAPAENVRESFRPSPEDISYVEDRAEVVKRWGRIYPVVRLHKLFGVPAARTEVSEAILVLVETQGQSVCLMVDEMIGQRQIVYKQLTVKTMEPSAFEGVSILDGTKMALILNVEGIIKQFQNVEGEILVQDGVN